MRQRIGFAHTLVVTARGKIAPKPEMTQPEAALSLRLITHIGKPRTQHIATT